MTTTEILEAALTAAREDHTLRHTIGYDKSFKAYRLAADAALAVGREAGLPPAIADMMITDILDAQNPGDLIEALECTLDVLDVRAVQV